MLHHYRSLPMNMATCGKGNCCSFPQCTLYIADTLLSLSSTSMIKLLSILSVVLSVCTNRSVQP